MKKTLMVLVVSLGVQMTYSQVAVVNYMKVAPGGNDKYVAIEQQWKKVHQKLVDEGKMIGWELFYVHDQGTASMYNYVTVNIYKDVPSSVTGMNMDDIKAVWGDKTNDMLLKTGQARNLVYTETSARQFGIPDKNPEKYLLVSYMKADDPQKYLNMEKTAFMPMHEVAINKGDMNGWAIWSPLLFDNIDYNAIAINSYSTADQLGKMDYQSWFKEASMGKSSDEISEMNNLIQNSGTIRTIVKAQVWELLDMTDPPKSSGMGTK